MYMCQMNFAGFNKFSELIQEIDEVDNLLYDVTTKPSGTIEWE